MADAVGQRGDFEGASRASHADTSIDELGRCTAGPAYPFEDGRSRGCGLGEMDERRS
jgi:hypothetical protein